MALDMAAFELGRAGIVPPTLRLYGWNRATVTLGRHQSTTVVDAEYCHAHGIPIVRRPTGGRAVIHHLELTYAVTASLTRPLRPHVQATYRQLCSALVRAFRALGIDAELTPGEATQLLPRPSSRIPCFTTPAGGEVVVAGRKLVGSAMRTHHGHILQHGAVLLDWDGATQAGCLGLADDASVRPLVTTVAEQLGRTPPRSELIDAIVQGLRDELGIELEPGQRSADEAQLAAERASAFRDLTSVG
jgi:lipoate-protein ligase A